MVVKMELLVGGKIYRCGALWRGCLFVKKARGGSERERLGGKMRNMPGEENEMGGLCLRWIGVYRMVWGGVGVGWIGGGWMAICFVI